MRDPRVIHELLPDLQPGFPKVGETSETNHPSALLWLFRSSRTMYVAFRGSDGMGESLTDIFSGRKEVDLPEVKGLCHGGFLNQFNHIEPIIRQILQDHKDEFSKLIFTGHAIGAAVATTRSIHTRKSLATRLDLLELEMEHFVRGLTQKFKTSIDLLLKLILSRDSQRRPDIVTSMKLFVLKMTGRLSSGLTYPQLLSDERSHLTPLVMSLVSVFVHTQWEFVERINAACTDIVGGRRGGS